MAKATLNRSIIQVTLTLSAHEALALLCLTGESKGSIDGINRYTDTIYDALNKLKNRPDLNSNDFYQSINITPLDRTNNLLDQIVKKWNEL